MLASGDDGDGDDGRRHSATSYASRAQRRREEQPWTPSAWDRVREGRWRLAPGAATGALIVVAGVVALLVLTAAGGAGSVPTPTPGVAVPARETPSGTGLPPGTGPSDMGPAREGTATAGVPATEVVVDVSGQVATPGLVRLPPGARVDDALRAAGGALGSADLRRVNRARLLTDGEHVVVPAPGELVPADVPAATPEPAGAGPGSTPPAAGTGPLDLNTATAAELDALPGVGPVLAQRILSWRAEHGRFSSVAELSEVAGIGPTTLARLTPLTTV